MARFPTRMKLAKPKIERAACYVLILVVELNIYGECPVFLCLLFPRA